MSPTMVALLRNRAMWLIHIFQDGSNTDPTLGGEREVLGVARHLHWGGSRHKRTVTIYGV